MSTNIKPRISKRTKTIINILSIFIVVGLMAFAVYEEGHNPLLYTVTVYHNGQVAEQYKHQTIRNMCDCSKDAIYLYPAKIYVVGSVGSSYTLQLEENDK